MGLVLLANLINVLGSFVMIRLALWIGTDLQSILFARISPSTLSFSRPDAKRGPLQQRHP